MRLYNFRDPSALVVRVLGDALAAEFSCTTMTAAREGGASVSDRYPSSVDIRDIRVGVVMDANGRRDAYPSLCCIRELVFELLRRLA